MTHGNLLFKLILFFLSLLTISVLPFFVDTVHGTWCEDLTSLSILCSTLYIVPWHITVVEKSLEERFCYINCSFCTWACILTKFNHERYLKFKKYFSKDSILEWRLLDETPGNGLELI